jgi:hypothetical protein
MRLAIIPARSLCLLLLHHRRSGLLQDLMQRLFRLESPGTHLIDCFLEHGLRIRLRFHLRRHALPLFKFLLRPNEVRTDVHGLEQFLE